MELSYLRYTPETWDADMRSIFPAVVVIPGMVIYAVRIKIPAGLLISFYTVSDAFDRAELDTEEKRAAWVREQTIAYLEKASDYSNVARNVGI